MLPASVWAWKTEIAWIARSPYHISSTDQVAGRNRPQSNYESWAQDSANDKEVVVMSHTVLSRRTKPVRRVFAMLVLIPVLPGCIAVATDVRDYYREMANNYHAEMEKAKMDAVTLEGESRMLAKNGDFHRFKRTEREVARIKAWEAKCAKQEARFEKAAHWTEEHYHLDHQPAKRKPTPNLDEETAAPNDRFAMPPLFDAKDQ
jgi:hypothetical protein